MTKPVLLPKISKKGPFTVDASGYEKVEGETIPRRHVAAKDALRTIPNPEITTTYENLRYAAKTYGNAKAVGSRKLVKTHVETKTVKKIVNGEEQEVPKDWYYAELSGYTYMTFVEYEALALQLGAGLRKLGHEKGSRLHLFSNTR
jgi:long-chain acyl-CoA synthetase